jgi:aspartate aminotransferase
MTGWRVGYCAGPAAVMKLVRDLQSHSSTCLPPFVEEAATYAISQGPSLLKDGLELMRKRRDAAVRILRDTPDVTFVPPHGAFYLFIDVRPALAKMKTKMTSMELGEQLLMKQHIALVPGEAFGAPGFLRLSYATDEKTVEEGLHRLSAGLKELVQGGRA